MGGKKSCQGPHSHCRANDRASIFTHHEHRWKWVPGDILLSVGSVWYLLAPRRTHMSHNMARPSPSGGWEWEIKDDKQCRRVSFPTRVISARRSLEEQMLSATG